MYVIGTAGHVDHGKSTLVRALTGIDPDRLREEKQREMTIDLGFAWLTLEGMEGEIGLVDVPGHRDFIENMLAGIGGIDLALLVIAADEGMMPQTREHLAILDLLQVKGGVVALTKTDLVDDEEWVELVTLEVLEALEGTVLAGAPIVPVAALAGTGLDTLKQQIVEKLQQTEKRVDAGRARLPIDRVFSLTGFGTVVTGTLLDGRLEVGQPVEIQPQGLKGRIRGLQTHQSKKERVEPGSRVAVNLTGVEKGELMRGSVVAAEGGIRSTILLDAQYDHLASADHALKHNSTIKFFTGSAEVLARTRILGQAEIRPGERGWVQFALQSPIPVLRGDRYIIRRPSPPATIGGGRILDPHPGRQHRRFRPDVIERLKTLEEGTPGELLLQKLTRVEPVNVNKFKRQSGLEENDFVEALQEMLDAENALLFDNQLLSAAKFKRYVSQVGQRIASYHRDNPLRLGMSLEEVRSREGIPAAVLPAVIERSGVVQEGSLLRLPDHQVSFDEETQREIDRLLARLDQAGINTPSVKECKGMIGENPYYALIDTGRLVQLDSDLVYHRPAFERYRAELVKFIHEKGAVSAAEVRDLWQTSRKYAIGFLEYFDQQKITRRVGDQRELIGSGPPAK